MNLRNEVLSFVKNQVNDYRNINCSLLIDSYIRKKTNKSYLDNDKIKECLASIKPRLKTLDNVNGIPLLGYSLSVSNDILDNVTYTKLKELTKIESIKRVKLNLTRKISLKNEELMSGNSGLIDYLAHNYFDESINLILLELERIYHLIGYNNSSAIICPKWSTKDFFNLDDIRDFPDGHIRFGLAHGSSSLLIFLAKCLKKDIGNNKINKDKMSVVIDHLVNEIIYTNNITSWPAKKDIIVHDKYKSNVYIMSWCYGVAGICYSISLAGEALNEKWLKDFSEKILIKNIENIDYDYLFDSFSICHGYLGLYLVMRRLGLSCEKLHYKLIEHANKFINGFGNEENHWNILNGYTSSILGMCSLFLENEPDDVLNKMIFLSDW
ncbi:MAG: lanthionine synthetase LanC family protein [Staphylococcus simulans]|uniref:lanthionine synthetase LanC family protein n=1 Tax=Staphylococcus TaxID=1279 RepID=UPI0008AA0FB0|nr:MULTISPECIES: lanthionine synthetase LanC family protein [Staphylococcus]MDK7925966.1 lanthionine synthetase LanC family protein [Staphylococcus simulans]MDK8314556.1 lanthionine synthetase LanC family protein [Staphylococcus simulans]OHR47387.1 hypothetical protein HMPREF2951_04830 [Staphylococcus sp. HMSC056D08]OHS48415.1 hypothetical protein HMPREF3270_01490 [Staphylococcus sp. HMSC65H10]